MNSKKTLVLGASTNPQRYAFTAVRKLTTAKHPVIALGIKSGKIDDIEIQTDRLPFENIDTITLYLSPKHQSGYYDYILSLKPKRIIFNPGTENVELINLAKAHGIEVEIGCTLVMLSIGNY